MNKQEAFEAMEGVVKSKGSPWFSEVDRVNHLKGAIANLYRQGSPSDDLLVTIAGICLFILTEDRK